MRPQPHTLALTVTLTLALAGCAEQGDRSSAATAAAVGSRSQPPPASASPAPAPAPPAPVSRWWAGDFHVHSAHSGDGVDTVAQTAALGRLVGLDFAVLTDHSTLTQRGDPDFDANPDLALLAGYEWTDILHMGLIGAQSVQPKLSGSPADWPAQAQAVIDQVHAEGGAAILNHPTWNHFPSLLDLERYDAIEVWNNLWTLSDTGLHPSTSQDLQDRLQGEGLAAAGVRACPEIYSALASPGGGNDRAVAYWEAALSRGKRVAAVGGSDRHKLLPPGYPTTWVLAPSRSEADIVAAVRAGRTIVTQGPEGPRVTFEADAGQDGVFEATIGDELPTATLTTFRVRVEGAADGLLRVVRQGRVLVEERISSDDHEKRFSSMTYGPDDWFRVDVYRRVDWSLPAATQATQVATGGGNVHALLTLWGVTATVGTNFPAITLDPKLRRIANITLLEPQWSRAAITSPIYVGSAP